MNWTCQLINRRGGEDITQGDVGQGEFNFAARLKSVPTEVVPADMQL